MRVTPYYLDLSATLHIGKQGIEQEQTMSTAPADTLFAALLVASMEGGCPPDVWGRAFASAQTAPLWLGSAFPYAGGVRFYPRPLVDMAGYGLGSVDAKGLRRIAYVSEDIWQRILSGHTLSAVYPNGDDSSGAFLQDGLLWLTREEVDALPTWMRQTTGRAGGRARPLRALEHHAVWKDDQMPRVTVDRLQRGSEIYYTGRVAYASECGLWFPVAWRMADASACDSLTWRVLFERALSLLADAGLGGDRSAGLGGFTWRVGADEDWPAPQTGKAMVTLSRYHPSTQEMPTALQGDAVRYGLISVAGYLFSAGQAAQRRRRLWFVQEGSVVTTTDAQGMGDLTDVRPTVGEFPHPVWRYGLAFPVPLEVPHA